MRCTQYRPRCTPHVAWLHCEELAGITWNHYWLTVGVCWLRLGCYFKEKAARRLETLVTLECNEAFEFWSKIKRYRRGGLYGTHEIHTLKRWPSSVEGRSLRIISVLLVSKMHYLLGWHHLDMQLLVLPNLRPIYLGNNWENVRYETPV